MNTAADECAEKKASRGTLLSGINGVFFILIVALSLLVDGNGMVLGMNYAASTTTAVVAFTAALAAAGGLAVRGHGWVRGCGIALILFYVLMLLPAVWPW